MHWLPFRGLLVLILGIAGWPGVAATFTEPVFKQPPRSLGEIGAGEGPVWHEDGYLLFTGGNRITKRTADGVVSVHREPAGGANGLLWDKEGRLVVCEAASRRVTRTEQDGAITVLADRHEGSRFNSPNDLSMDSKGRIYFSDPRYGSREGMEIRDADGLPVEGVYRIDAPGRVVRVLGKELERPNGVLVSADNRLLYVADNNNSEVGGARRLWRFILRRDGSVRPGSGKVIFDWGDARGPDGLKQDRQGRLYVAAGLNVANPPYETADRWLGGIYVLSPEGKLLQFVGIPTDEVTNCAFGGRKGRTLYVTAGGRLWELGGRR